MADYLAPLEDMNFVLNEHLDLAALAALPGYEDLSPDLAASILEEAGKLATNVLSPLNASGDRAGVKVHGDAEVATPPGFRDAYQQFTDAGWGSLQFDPDYGGQGLPFALAIPVQEMWHAANMAWGLCPLLSQGAIEALEVNASDELKTRYLPNMISGRWNGTMNLTEPQAGSDMATLRTRAERDGDHYRIYGQKIYITWGENDMTDNVVHLVLARLPDGPPGVKGISLFLVPKFIANEDGTLGARNDLQVLSVEHKLGVHGSPTCVMSYGENEGAIGFLVGQEHRGLACMFSMMNNARLTVGLQGVSIAERAYQLARDHALERKQGVAPGETEIGNIVKHPDVRRMLLTMRALTEASRAVAYVACASVDFRNKHPDPAVRALHDARSALLTPVVKGWCTEIGPEVASLGVQVHGGMGFIEETGAAQYLRDARILPIYEGTNGIQAMDLVERKTRLDKGAAVDSLITDMRAVIASANETGQPELQTMAGQMNEAVTALEQIKTRILTDSESDIYFAGSASFNYLMMMGVVCGGWQMLVASIAAAGRDASNSFTRNKLIIAAFYMDHILPRYLTHASAIESGSDSIMGLPEEAF
ncbi:MAG: acyl-CoA dehydrogenase [Gammaproteobacteria bacterium]|nr:acyl-CoA dehydrogenase [Gammaproteobacteria bacterium]